MRKRDRHDLLLKLIGDSPQASQAVLAGRLAENGFRVTQASISRDLDELGFTKRGGRYVRQGASPKPEAVAVEAAGSNLIVVKCEAGLASAVAVQIDRAQLEGIVGTIAGDDTIFLAVRDAESRDSVMARLTVLV